MNSSLTKEAFITALKARLTHLPDHEQKEIIRDQEEYILDALSAGRAEHEVILSLGSPEDFAQNLSAQNRIQKAEQASSLSAQMSGTWKAALAVIALTPFNFLIVLGPFLTVVSLLSSGFMVGAAVSGGSILGLLVFLFHSVFIKAGWAVHLSQFFLILGGILGGVSLILFMGILTRAFIKITLRYLRWNVNLIKKASK
jgi:uncharacterized membrane protein